MRAQTIVDQITREFNDRRDEAVYAALERCGYSKEWFFDPNHMDRICITLITHPLDLNETLVYSVDGVNLFAVSTYMSFDPKELKVNISVNVTYFEN